MAFAGCRIAILLLFAMALRVFIAIANAAGE